MHLPSQSMALLRFRCGTNAEDGEYSEESRSNGEAAKYHRYVFDKGIIDWLILVLFYNIFTISNRLLSNTMYVLLSL